jgi:DNA-binding protein HU-beta
MNKKELVDRVALATGLSKQTITQVVNAVIDAVMKAVCAGEKVQIVDFGSIEPRKRKARSGRSPKTGAEITIPETVVPAFSAGKAFKDMVNTSR